MEAQVVYHLTNDSYSKRYNQVATRHDHFVELPVVHNDKVVAFTEGRDYVVSSAAENEEPRDLQSSVSLVYQNTVP